VLLDESHHVVARLAGHQVGAEEARQVLPAPGAVDGDDLARTGEPPPCSALRPTAPQPITATEAPGATFASRTAAPTPVITPQPIRQARSNGISFGTLIAPDCGTTAYWACDDTT
jgi:hypothetical protein